MTDAAAVWAAYRTVAEWCGDGGRITRQLARTIRRHIAGRHYVAGDRLTRISTVTLLAVHAAAHGQYDGHGHGVDDLEAGE